MSTTSERHAVEASPVYPAGSRVNERGHLEIGGSDVVDVVAEFGTPAYIYAEADIRSRARAYLDAFRSRTDDYEVLYASKAAPITAIYKLCAEEGLSVDVASGGELHMACARGSTPLGSTCTETTRPRPSFDMRPSPESGTSSSTPSARSSAWTRCSTVRRRS